MNERDSTIPKMADQIGRIANVWEGCSGIVHCNSYKIADRLYQRLPSDVKKRTTLQDGDDREGSLDRWVEKDPTYESQYKNASTTIDDSGGGGQVFLSVANDEGISLDDDQARFNIVAKASYPFLGDSRVSYRINELSDWEWYNANAIIDLQQAAGRTMRSKDDWTAVYILDDSAVDLIKRNEHLCESWFLDAVDCDFDDSVVSPENCSSCGEDEESSLDDIADEYFG